MTPDDEHGEWSPDFAGLHLPDERAPRELADPMPAPTSYLHRSGHSHHLGGEAAPSAPTIPHASYLGASDIGAILGLDPMRTALDVWAEKTGRVVTETSDEIEAGNDHEAGVVAGARRRLRRAGIADRVDYPGPGTIVVFDVEPPMTPIPGFGSVIDGDAFEAWKASTFQRGATLDAVPHHRDHGPCVLEAKLVGAGMAGAWGPEPAGAEGIPARTFVQVHWQTHHARERFGWAAPVAFVAADIAGTDRRLYEIPIDDAVIGELLSAARAWWRRHVIEGEMPEPTERDVDTLGRIFPEAKRPLSPFVPLEIRERAEEYAAAREVTMHMRRELARYEARLLAALGEAEGYRWHGGKVTWRNASDGSRRLHVRIWQPSS